VELFCSNDSETASAREELTGYLFIAVGAYCFGGIFIPVFFCFP
jgi:hypothetical protein